MSVEEEKRFLDEDCILLEEAVKMVGMPSEEILARIRRRQGDSERRIAVYLRGGIIFLERKRMEAFAQEEKITDELNKVKREQREAYECEMANYVNNRFERDLATGKVSVISASMPPPGPY